MKGELMPDTNHYDAIVIGAGLGGLSTAGYLAKAGKRVLVLEHHSVPGGYAHEFRRGKFRFEVALHAMDGVSEGGWVYPVLADLGVLDQVEFHRLDPFYTACFPEHEVAVHTGREMYADELIRHFPEEADGIREFLDNLEHTEAEVKAFTHARSQGERIPMQEMPARFPNMALAMMQSWGDYMDRFVKDAKLKAILSTLWGYFGLPPSTLTGGGFAMMLASYMFHGAYYPEGGSFAISKAIVNTIREHGGEVKYNQTVTSIEMKDGLAHAVETQKGLRATADLIVSNASAPETIANLIGAEHFEDSYASKGTGERVAASNLVVYLGLDVDLRDLGYHHHELFVSNTYDIEESYRNMIEGNWERADIVITNYGPVCERACPRGYSALMIMCLATMDYEDQWGTGGDFSTYRKNPRYLELKERAGEALIDQAAKHIPKLREHIIEKEIATPLTNLRYSLNPGGSIYGSEQTVGNMYMNRLSPKTPIPNLVLTGAWVSGGGMSTALVSGRSAAGIGLSYLEKQGETASV